MLQLRISIYSISGNISILKIFYEKICITFRGHMRVRKAEPVERSKTRISIVQAVTSHVRFKNGKIEKYKIRRRALSKRD